MRYFNNTEKEVIDYICNAKPTSDAATIKKLLETKCDCTMQFENGIFTIYVNNLAGTRKIVTEILNIICLLEYLKTE